MAEEWPNSWIASLIRRQECLNDDKRWLIQELAEYGWCSICGTDLMRSGPDAEPWRRTVLWTKLAAGCDPGVSCGDCFDTMLDQESQKLCDELQIGACRAESLVRQRIYSIDGRDLFAGEEEARKMDGEPERAADDTPTAD